MGQAKRGEVCAWPVEVAVDALNVAYPEAKASYFVMPYMLAPGQSLILNGRYPLARFSSLVTYFGLGQPGRDIEVLGWLRDSEIDPQLGSVNPARDADASSDPLRREWAVRVTGTMPVDDASPRRHRDPGRLRAWLDEWAQRPGRRCGGGERHPRPSGRRGRPARRRDPACLRPDRRGGPRWWRRPAGPGASRRLTGSSARSRSAHPKRKGSGRRPSERWS